MSMHSTMPFTGRAAARSAVLGLTAALTLTLITAGFAARTPPAGARPGGSGRVVAAGAPAPGDLEWD